MEITSNKPLQKAVFVKDFRADLGLFWQEKTGLMNRDRQWRKTKEKTNKVGRMVAKPRPESQLSDVLLFSTLAPLLHAEWTKSISRLELKVYLKYTFFFFVWYKTSAIFHQT